MSFPSPVSSSLSDLWSDKIGSLSASVGLPRLLAPSPVGFAADLRGMVLDTCQTLSKKVRHLRRCRRRADFEFFTIYIYLCIC